MISNKYRRTKYSMCQTRIFLLAIAKRGSIILRMFVEERASSSSSWNVLREVLNQHFRVMSDLFGHYQLCFGILGDQLDEAATGRTFLAFGPLVEEPKMGEMVERCYYSQVEYWRNVISVSVKRIINSPVINNVH